MADPDEVAYLLVIDAK